MKKHFILLLLALSFIQIQAQHRRKNNDEQLMKFGIKVGSVNTKISDLSKVLVSESYYTGYTFENSNEWGLTGGIYLNYKFEESQSALYTEMSYSMLGNNLHYSDVYDLNYDFALKYNFFSLDIWYKVYLVEGLNLGAGPRLGFNLTPGNLFYTSNSEELFGPDIRIQQQMRDVLKGRDNFSLGLSLGYEFDFGLSIDARFYYGISDVVETEVNNFNFVENRNKSQVLQFTLGYAIPYSF